MHVNVSDFAISQEDMTKSSENVADYTGVKAITLAFYSSTGALSYSSTQLRADSTSYATFGEFDLTLPMDSYTMEVFAYGSEQPLTHNGIAEASYTANKVRETFVATQTVNITGTSQVIISATLHRINNKLQLFSTDPQPASIDSVRITYSAGGRSFNPLTGYATVNSGLVNSVKSVPGSNGLTRVGSYIFQNANKQYVDITIDAIDTTSAVVFHKEIINVPLRRNAVTTLQGSMYSAAATSLFTLHTDYDGLIVINF